MRKIIVAAAIAVCFAVPGMASANVFAAPLQMEQPEINQQLLEGILKAVEAQTDYAYGCLCEMYAAGELTIYKNQDGQYVVEGGGLGQILIDETI